MTFETFRQSSDFLSTQIAESDGIITLGHLGLYVLLSRRLSECFTFPALSKITGISEKTLHNYIRTLEALELIARVSSNKGVRFKMLERKTYPSKIDYGSLSLYSLTINTNLINTNINICAVKKEKLEIHEAVISDLNAVGSRSFRLNASDTIKKISWLLTHGYTLDDFKKVHRNKRDWLTNEKMSIYYRPKTLYAQENFESYLNEHKAVDPSKATTTKWQAPEKKKDTESRRAKLAERWNGK